MAVFGGFVTFLCSGFAGLYEKKSSVAICWMDAPTGNKVELRIFVIQRHDSNTQSPAEINKRRENINKDRHFERYKELWENIYKDKLQLKWKES